MTGASAAVPAWFFLLLIHDNILCFSTGICKPPAGPDYGIYILEKDAVKWNGRHLPQNHKRRGA